VSCCKVDKSGKALKSGTFSLEMALDIHEKGFSISKTILVGKNLKV